MSLDYLISKPKDYLSILSLVEQKAEDNGYAAVVKKTINTVILTRKTSDWVISIVGA